MSQESSLNFLQSWTLEEFKKQQQSSFQVLKKPNGHWFRCGTASGQVSSKLDLTNVNPTELLVSRVQKPGEEDDFLLLHGQGGTVVMTL